MSENKEVVEPPKKRSNRVSQSALKEYHHAIECNDLAGVRRMLDKGQSIKENSNQSVYHGRSLQGHACEEGNVMLVRQLLDAGVSKDLGFPLHAACREYNVKMVKVQLEYNVAVDEIDLAGEVCLAMAARHNEGPIVVALLAAKADVELSGIDGKTALMCASEQGHKAVITHLLNSGADVHARNSNNTMTSQHYAAAEGQHVVVSLLLAHGADVNAQLVTGDTPLQLACKSAELRTVKVLQKVADLKAEGALPLVFACETGEEAVVQCLIKEGMLGFCDELIPSPIAACIASERRAQLSMLLQQREWTHQHIYFQWACSAGVKKIVLPFLDYIHDLSEPTDNSQQTCLHKAAMQEDAAVLAKQLSTQQEIVQDADVPLE